MIRLLLLLCLLFQLSLLSASPQLKGPKPEDVVQKFMNKMLKLDFLGAKAYASAASAQSLEETDKIFRTVPASLQGEQKELFETQMLEIKQSTVELLSCKIEGESCLCSIKVCKANGNCETSQVPLLKEGGEWKVDLSKQQEQKN